MMKKPNDNLFSILFILFVVVVAIAVYGGAYLIANSNLPDWFKFFLLK